MHSHPRLMLYLLIGMKLAACGRTPNIKCILLFNYLPRKNKNKTDSSSTVQTTELGEFNLRPTSNSIGFFKTCISVRPIDRSKATQNKINFIKNCRQWSVNAQPPYHHSNAIPTELGSKAATVGQKISEVSFISCTFFRINGA